LPIGELNWATQDIVWHVVRSITLNHITATPKMITIIVPTIMKEWVLLYSPNTSAFIHSVVWKSL